MDVRLIISKNSLRNTTLSNDSLGVHYTVSTADGITSVTRHDIRKNVEVVVGQFETPAFRKDRIRLGQDGEWQLLGDFLSKATDRGFGSAAMSFKANNGRSYRWKPRKGDLVMTEDSAHQPALVTYKYHHKKNSSYLEMSDSSLLGGFDNILLTFLITGKKRQESGGGGGGGGGGAGGFGGG